MREMNKLVISGRKLVMMSGRKLADEIQGRLKDETAELRTQGITPGLATVLVGDDPPSAIYIAMKHMTCEEIGIRCVGEILEPARRVYNVHIRRSGSRSTEVSIPRRNPRISFIGRTGTSMMLPS